MPFGDYHIHRLLGRGGMGEVYEAEEKSSGRRVALKVMNQALASEQDRKRFLREGRLAAAVSHPNVVYIYGSEEIQGSPVIAMELVSSGTLNDRLRSGPLPPAEAVDVILQVIAGLDAAQATGVLHRDIKPANCFVGADGTVKVGDFGLSISTIARGETLLTARGSVLGTPAYASPEQLRGEELGVAADIYSVGATLYHLLTAQLPYRSHDFVQLITEVLDKTPIAPERVRPEIPRGLSNVVMRCLAKVPSARFANYAALREALLPFSSFAPTPAVLGLRFVAGVIDEFVSYLPAMAVLVWTGKDVTERLAADRSSWVAIALLVFLVWDCLYFAIPEGRWGASVGKAICGLRVVGPNRGPAGLARTLWRALIYRLTWSLPLLASLVFFTSAEYAERLSHGQWTPMEWLWFPVLALLFSTMRRSNGFAGIHELLSGTRVVARPLAELRPSLREGTAAPIAPSLLREKTLGPYEVIGSLGKVGEDELLLAHDPALRRNLWIHWQAPGTPPVDTRRHDLSRATRLRWLNGQRAADQAWDAYEALEGKPLLELPPQGWTAVRYWLWDLAREYAAGRRHDSLPPVLSLDRIWITPDHRAVVLDFPRPRDPSHPPLLPVLTAEKEDFPAMQQFFAGLAAHALGGEARGVDVGIPLHARPFLQSLSEGRFESPEILVGNLQSILGKPAEISRRRRLATLGLAYSPAIILAVIVAATFWIGHKRVMRTWPANFPGSAELRAELLAFDTFRDHPAVESLAAKQPPTTQPEEDVSANFRRAFRIHIAAHHRAVIEDSNFWAHPVVAETLTAEHRSVATEAVAQYSDATPKRLAEADATIRLLQPAITAADTETPIWVALGGFWALLILVALIDIGSALMVGDALFLRLLGLAILNRKGVKAGRLRVFWRTIVAWSPCLLGTPLSLALWWSWLPGIGLEAPLLFWSLALLFLAMLLCAAWAVWKPSRSLPDYLAGTVLAPR
jgi:uncharacterized RDD family membrane protein YckC